jgi:phenylalanyl-tRNA synthetase beta chain
MEEFPGAFGGSKPIALSMPMSEERSSLRTSLVPHLIEVISYNRNRNIDDVAVFEIGKAFLARQTVLSELPEERLLLTAAITGRRQDVHWSGKADKVDFYDLKGIFERLVDYLGIENIAFSAAQPEGYHPGRTAEIKLGGHTIGYIGQLHPGLQQNKDLEDTFVFEVELEPLAAHANRNIAYKPLPRYPSIGRDMALVVDTSVPVANIIAEVKKAAGSLLESIQVFDVYTGERLGAGKKSVAFSLVYRTPERTLTDEEVSGLHAKVVSAMEQIFGAELRK